MSFGNEKYKDEYVNRACLMDKMMADCNPEHFPGATAKDVFTCAIANIEVAPTASVMPVVHAQWESVEDAGDGDVFRCSNCKTENHIKTVLGKPAYKFCPKCGAKID